MFFEPPTLLMLTVLVAVTGFVARGIITALKGPGRDGKPAADRMSEMEERMRKLEAATSSLLVDVTGMREKQRFMARLGESSASRAAQPAQAAPRESDLSPMVTQSIPIVPRGGRSP